MTTEELYAQLYSTGAIYRPPLEWKSAVLEVASGCNYGQCLFCDYRRDDYRTFSLEEIEKKTRLLSCIINGNDNLHLMGCNPLCLDTEYLLSVIDCVHTYLPSVKRITAYARADSILEKSSAELRAIRDAGLMELHVGFESGSDRVLKMQNKGETAEMIENALNKLSENGMYYHLSAIPGMGGRDLSDEHAMKSAELLSRLTPLSIWCIALKVFDNTPLSTLVKNGKFPLMSYLEVLKEERKMLDALELKAQCVYVDSTVLGKYTLIVNLPEKKQIGLERMDRLISEGEHDLLT